MKHEQTDTLSTTSRLEWYAKRASAYKNWTQLLGFGVIFAGAATSFLQVFSPASWVPPLTAGLGALIALSEGWQRVTRYAETWVAYRTAAERMRRERRLYANSAAAYRGLDNEGAFLQLVENIEAIVAEEQQVYWRNRGGEDRAERTASKSPAKNTDRGRGAQNASR